MEECRIRLENGRTLICPVYPEEVSWIRVEEEQTGKSLGLWVIPEENPRRDLPHDILETAAGHLVADNVAEEWGGINLEANLTLQNGCVIVTDEEVSFISVQDEDREEIAYWDSQEWVDDPRLVLGAILGAANGGKLAGPSPRNL